MIKAALSTDRKWLNHWFANGSHFRVTPNTFGQKPCFLVSTIVRGEFKRDQIRPWVKTKEWSENSELSFPLLMWQSTVKSKCDQNVPCSRQAVQVARIALKISAVEIIHLLGKSFK